MENIFAENDIICLAETWLQYYDSVMFWSENEFEEIKTDALRRHSKGRFSSGMSLFVRKLLKPGYEIISSDSNHIWLKLKKEFFGIDEDYTSALCTSTLWVVLGRFLTTH